MSPGADLARSPIEVVGRFASASNVTLLCRLGDEDELAVYKPAAGETPLWDFPQGTLHLREVAAYVVDRALGWSQVPETVLRDDGPYGPGSLQRFVPHDPAAHYFTLLEEGSAEVLASLRRMVVFDLVVNNTDRKGGHVLLAEDGALRLVDHGVCFHEEEKVRTVAWDFAGEPVPDDLRADVAALAGRLADDGDPLRRLLGTLLSPDEVEATRRRAESVAGLGVLPEPRGRRPYPWPPI